MIKVSKKEMNNEYFIINAPYCSLQYLLTYKGARFYSAGVYGWSCDYYIIDSENTAISTGYSTCRSCTDEEYKLIVKYENKAKKILNQRHDYDTTKKQLDSLIIKLIREVKAIK